MRYDVHIVDRKRDKQDIKNDFDIIYS